jgi:hypothetical protein
VLTHHELARLLFSDGSVRCPHAASFKSWKSCRLVANQTGFRVYGTTAFSSVVYRKVIGNDYHVIFSERSVLLECLKDLARPFAAHGASFFVKRPSLLNHQHRRIRRTHRQCQLGKVFHRQRQTAGDRYFQPAAGRPLRNLRAGLSGLEPVPVQDFPY